MLGPNRFMSMHLERACFAHKEVAIGHGPVAKAEHQVRCWNQKTPCSFS
jgi:hypothetical protein